MHARSWNRCLAFCPSTGEWCQRQPSDGVFCPSHAREFRCDEAAKAATRLGRGQLVLRDPSSTPWQRWCAARRTRRARSLRQVLLAEIDDALGIDPGVAVTPRDLVRPSAINRWR
jgi:hypothetical protein